MARGPSVISTSPANYARDILANTSIRFEFQIDLDSRYINDFVFMTDSAGNPVTIRSSYRAKVLTVTPLSPLSLGTTYQVTLVGDADLQDGVKKGIRSIIGDCMEGNYVLTFSTESDVGLEPPSILTPAHGSIIRSQPVFSWEAVVGASGYQLQLSESNTFGSVLYPTVEQTIAETTLEADIQLEDGIYYLRMRSVREDGAIGDWSRPYQFNIDTLNEGSISTDDLPDVGDFPLYDDAPLELELVEVFPKELENLVPLNVESLYFRFIGDVNVSLIDADSLTLVGQHISGDFQEKSHGVVSGTTTIVKSDDGTTYVIFTPDSLPTETVGGN